MTKMHPLHSTPLHCIPSIHSIPLHCIAFHHHTYSTHPPLLPPPVEQAWSSSGGGFSNTFGIPSYQAKAVAHYKRTATLPPAHLYNNTGRGYPDVSALGGQVNPYCVVTRGTYAGVAGTSASSPVVAGVFARLNGLRLAAGKAPMGFLNPFIYRNPSGFQDVSLGTNDEGRAANKGFDAVAGWDPATGLGTPDYEALAQLV